MKYSYFLLLLFTTNLNLQSVFSQDKVTKPQSSNASNIFFELGGNGFLSLNYDGRFSKKDKGLGGRIGLGIIPGVNTGLYETSTFVTIPIGLNYLAGKGPHYFEAGAGGTIGTGKFKNFFGAEAGEKETGVVFVPSIGYRYQPIKKGLTGRIVLSPLIGNGFMWFGGVSIGMRF